MWERSSGTATLEGWTVVFRPINESYRDEVPYILAIVRLREGPLMLTRLVGMDVDVEPTIGMALEVGFDELRTGTPLPVFRPASSPPDAGGARPTNDLTNREVRS
jgi:uncharacterized OB-fold protein